MAAATLFTFIDPGYAQVVEKSRVLREVKSHLAMLIATGDPTLEIDRVVMRHDMRVRDGKVDLAFNVDQDKIKPGRLTIPVKILIDGLPEADLNVVALLKRYIAVPVARQSLKRGSIVTARDVKMKRMEMSRPIDGLVADVAEVIGLAPLRTVRAGVPLRAKWFDEPLAVDRGERVRVKLINGGLVINTVGIAMSKGRIGDMVQLKNPKSQIRYEAKVMAPGQARIQNW